MKKIVVTGATSMIGVALIEAAIIRGIEVYAVIRPCTKRIDRIPKSSLIHVVETTLDNLQNTEGIAEDCDVFYHFAWLGTSKAERDDPIIQEANIKYTLDAVKFANKCGCKKFIGAGSQAEYGPHEHAIDEQTECKPLSSYGACKLAAGFLSRKLCDKYGMIHIWGRIFSVYGKHDNEETLLSYAIDQFLKGETAKFSSGRQIWNYLNERDAGELFYLLGEKVINDDIFLIANNESRPLREYITEVACIMNANELCDFASDSDNSNIYGIDTIDNKLFSTVDYWPKVTFKSGITEIIEAMKLKN